MSAPMGVKTNVCDADLWSDEDDLLLLESCTEGPLTYLVFGFLTCTPYKLNKNV